MQTFLPDENYEESARILDWRRLGKQRVEGMQIINAIENPNKQGWQNHPATIMWTPYISALKLYTNVMITEWINRGYNNNMEFYDDYLEGLSIEGVPRWPEEFYSSHRANLLRKDYEYYSQFKWREDPNEPYVWHYKEGLWYEQIVGTGERVYLKELNE